MSSPAGFVCIKSSKQFVFRPIELFMSNLCSKLLNFLCLVLLDYFMPSPARLFTSGYAEQFISSPAGFIYVRTCWTNFVQTCWTSLCLVLLDFLCPDLPNKFRSSPAKLYLWLCNVIIVCFCFKCRTWLYFLTISWPFAYVDLDSSILILYFDHVTNNTYKMGFV